jgi:hypothetical protein
MNKFQSYQGGYHRSLNDVSAATSVRTRASGLTAGLKRARWHFDPISNIYLLKGYATGMPVGSSSGHVGKLLKKRVPTQTGSGAHQSVRHGLVSVNSVSLLPVRRSELT